MSEFVLGKSYKTFVFDCDGVILNSNHVKTAAFYNAALPYGETAANEFVDYHTSNGGVSRYTKFEHFLQHIVSGREGPGIDELLHNYASQVVDGLMNCDVVPGLRELRAQTKDIGWMIVSGGDQTELRKVFAARGLDNLFDKGIFGSPDPKEFILERELNKKNIERPALFLGDSKYDYIASQSVKLDFLFISEWSEIKNWEDWVKSENLSYCPSISSLRT